MFRVIEYFFDRPLLLAGTAAAVMITGFALPSYLYAHHTGGSMTALVTDKERVCDGGQNGDCQWMVMTDQMAFINVDSLWHLKYDSTDLQSKISVGEEYHITYYGWRIPFFSAYPNIVSVE